MLGCKPALTPIVLNHQLDSKVGEQVNKEMYQKLAGNLSHTRSDTTYPMSLVS